MRKNELVNRGEGVERTSSNTPSVNVELGFGLKTRHGDGVGMPPQLYARWGLSRGAMKVF